MYKQHTLHNGRVIFEKEVVEVLGDECGQTRQRQSCDSVKKLNMTTFSWATREV